VEVVEIEGEVGRHISGEKIPEIEGNHDGGNNGEGVAPLWLLLSHTLEKRDRSWQDGRVEPSIRSNSVPGLVWRGPFRLTPDIVHLPERVVVIEIRAPIGVKFLPKHRDSTEAYQGVDAGVTPSSPAANDLGHDNEKDSRAELLDYPSVDGRRQYRYTFGWYIIVPVIHVGRVVKRVSVTTHDGES